MSAPRLTNATKTPASTLNSRDAAHAERADDAADVYALVAGVDEDPLYARRRVQALYESGRFESALDACRRLAERATSPRFCTETESLIYEQLGDLPRARQICQGYLQDHPGDVGVLLRLGGVLIRSSDEDSEGALAAVLAQLDRNKAATNVDHARALSLLLEGVGRFTEALEVLFQARCRHKNNPAAHLQYIAGTNRFGRGIESPGAAGPDVAVELTGPGAPGWILLSTSEGATPSDGEYPLEHAVAKAVLGKHPGDSIVFPTNPAISWKVAALDSKYAFACRQSLSFFPSRFPTERSIEVHEIPEGEPGRFVEQLKERLVQNEPHRASVLQVYATGQTTVGSVASALHCSSLDAIGAVASSQSGLIGSTGSLEEKQAVAAVLRERDTVLVADVTACVLLDALGVLRDDALHARKLAITQTTLDEFRSEVLQWRTKPPDGFMSVGIHEGQLVRIDVTPDDIKSMHERHERLASSLKEKCTVLAVSPAIAEKHAKLAKEAKFLGESFWDSMLAASEPGRTLLSDDLALRRFFTQLSSKVSVCSPLLLQAEAEAGRLGAERYSTCIVDLVMAGYRHVSVDARVLQTAARSEQWRAQGRFLRVLDRLKGPETEPRSAAIVAGLFFRMLWFDVVLPQQRDSLWFAVLDALCTGRPAESVLPFFKSLLPGLFALLPQAQQTVVGTVAAWDRLRERSRTGIIAK